MNVENNFFTNIIYFNYLYLFKLNIFWPKSFTEQNKNIAKKSKKKNRNFIKINPKIHKIINISFYVHKRI